MPEGSRTILYVCQFNSARSQLAECLARSMAPPGTRVLSAGLTRTIVNEEVLRGLREIGLDGSAQWSKSLEEVAGERVDVVVTLAEEAMARARKIFPIARHISWSMPDPVAQPDADQMALAVRRSREELLQRIRKWFQEEQRSVQ